MIGLSQVILIFVMKHQSWTDSLHKISSDLSSELYNYFHWFLSKYQVGRHLYMYMPVVLEILTEHCTCLCSEPHTTCIFVDTIKPGSVVSFVLEFI